MGPRPRRLSGDERVVLGMMATGWTPFPMQCDRAGRGLVSKGLARIGLDDKGRQILVLTDAGRERASTAG